MLIPSMVNSLMTESKEINVIIYIVIPKQLNKENERLCNTPCLKQRNITFEQTDKIIISEDLSNAIIASSIEDQNVKISHRKTLKFIA